MPRPGCYCYAPMPCYIVRQAQDHGRCQSSSFGTHRVACSLPKEAVAQRHGAHEYWAKGDVKALTVRGLGDSAEGREQLELSQHLQRGLPAPRIPKALAAQLSLLCTAHHSPHLFRHPVSELLVQVGSSQLVHLQALLKLVLPLHFLCFAEHANGKPIPGMSQYMATCSHISRNAE